MKKTLIVSISGIRGIFGQGLDAGVLVKYVAAYGTWCKRRAEAAGRKPVVVVGRDGRVTGPLCAQIVTATLQSTGCDVIGAGLATTPTVEMAVLAVEAAGGIILSASHNPAEWNALKLLNEKGEFLSPEEGEEVIEMAEAGTAETVMYDAIGSYREHDFLDHHIDEILALDFIHAEQIAARVTEAGGTVEFVHYADEGHRFSKLSNRIDSFTRMAAFLNTHLKGQFEG